MYQLLVKVNHIILQIFNKESDLMDLLLGVVSMVKDINSIDKQYRNLNLQLKYTLDKANRFLKKLDNNEQERIGLIVLKTRMQEGQKLTKKLDDLLNTSAIAMKDKIRLSLPLDKTKTQIINVIETLEKMINQLKEDLSEEIKVQSRLQSKIQYKQVGIKRKISQFNQIELQTNLNKNNKNQLSVEEIDQHIEQVYEMGPTIREEEYQYSQSRNKEYYIQFKVSVHASNEIMAILESQQLIQSSTKIKQKQIPEEQVLYTVARMNFQKCYSKIKAITQDIDRISTKGHFHFIFKKTGDGQAPKQISRAPSSNKKIMKGRASNASQKLEQEVFFSFPSDQRANQFEFKLLAKKQDPSKTLYRICGQQWLKVQQSQIQLINGDKLAAFVNQKTKQPSIYFEIGYQICHN